MVSGMDNYEKRFTETRESLVDICNGISEGNLTHMNSDGLYDFHIKITDIHDDHKLMGNDYVRLFGVNPSPTYDDVFVLIESVEISIVNMREGRKHPK